MKLKKNIAISETGYIFNPSTGESFTLNQIGLEIINMAKENKSDDDIKKYLVQKYDTDETSLERYYLDFIEMLKQYHLLENGD
ncbi:MAG: PqqD family protein [Bacteroidales bacterium]